MRAVVQRVERAAVRVDGEQVGAIGLGLVVLVGVATDDTEADATWLAGKVRALRVFPDENETMNHSVEEVGGSVLAVSQFTLLGDARKGRRPSYVAAAPPERAEALYRVFVGAVREGGVLVEEGRFQAHMYVELINDGPVTILLDSKKKF